MDQETTIPLPIVSFLQSRISTRLSGNTLAQNKHLINLCPVGSKHFLFNKKKVEAGDENIRLCQMS